MLFERPPPPIAPRRVALPVNETAPVVCLNPLFNTPSIDALATFIKKARDTLDFGIDFTDWLKANGDTEISAVTWEPVTDPPYQDPPILSDQFFPGSEAWVMIGPGLAGDNYLIDCTATIAPTQARVGGDAVSTVERTIVRRIAIQVLAG
jgi:hypothetical protein